ncbi:MAG: PQQ-dependent dehydrogenase, methanol/ethanol family [Methylophilaceae bacterium]
MKIKIIVACATWAYGSFASQAINAATDLDAAMANPNNWAHARGQYNNQGFSELSQINTNNVKDLKLAWTFSTGVNRGHEGAPLVIDGVMYVHTAFPNNIYALDLNDDQKIIWSYFPKQDPQTQAVLCCGNVNRGLAFGDGNIYLQQNNGMLVALNAKTGEKVWDVQVTDPKTGATNTNAPMVVKDKVLTGCAGGEFSVRCFMAAYYLKDGAMAWKAYSTGPDAEVLIGVDFNKDNPQYSALSVYKDINGGNKEGGSFEPLSNDKLRINEPELGVRTWLKPQQEKDGWQNGGGAVTGYFGFDPKTNLVYYGTGNPGVWNPDVRPGDNKWASSVFARDVDTGKAKWAMQTTPHDEWDYDATNEVILFDRKDKHGKKQTYATQVNKNGFIYTWQANNGNLIAAEKVHPYVNWATSVDLKTGVPAKDAKYNTHQDVNTKAIYPSNMGAKGIVPASYSPKTKLVYIPVNPFGMSIEPYKTKYQLGEPWVGAYAPSIYRPNKIGFLSAFDPISAKSIWEKSEPYPLYSGVLSTKSNLVIYGTVDHWLKVIHAETGSLLRKVRLASGAISNPFSYSSKGKQYIGVLSGYGAWPNIADKIMYCPPTDFCPGYVEFSGRNNLIPSGGMLSIFSL